MAFPIFIPFLIKGAVVAAKAMAGKAALAKAAAGSAKVLISQYGAAQVLATSAAVATIAGGIAWSVENVERARRAYHLYNDGDQSGAALALRDLARSASVVVQGDLSVDLDSWLNAGMPLDGRLRRLVREVRAVANEAAATYAR